ncbi:MAG: hypothetical protein Q8N63_02115 [Nanoarchaeota archaeon]|nr:hypothetical protein [Nanoarchaeota archaeon]
MKNPVTIEQYYDSQISEISKETEDYDKKVKELKNLAKENQRFLLTYIKEELKDGKTPVRISVYDSSGDFQGYKADSFWTLHPAFSKIHPLLDALPSGHLIGNFLYCLKEDRKQNNPKPLLKNILYFLNGLRRQKEKDLEVVVEELDSEGEPVKVALKYHVFRYLGRYKAELFN